MIETMNEFGFHIEQYPELNRPLLIIGIDGWGNALNVSSGMITYLIDTLEAERIGKIDPDLFYRYDERRPVVEIENGKMKSISPPGGAFYVVRSEGGARDLVLLKVDEPNLRWFQFVNDLFTLSGEMGIDTIVTLGSMYDSVLHTDRIVSALKTSDTMFPELEKKNITSVSYQGPGAIHSLINAEGMRQGVNCISLWCHCPYYLEGATHFGLLAHLGDLLAFLGEFELDTKDLEDSWEQLHKQIQELIQNSPELQSAIQELRKAKVRGSWESMKAVAENDGNVISLKDFLKPQ
jgi:proteasome assembly chaperone (PAC2) family protein